VRKKVGHTLIEIESTNIKGIRFQKNSSDCCILMGYLCHS